MSAGLAAWAQPFGQRVAIHLDTEKGVASVWTSLGITSTPFVPPAQRIRGRGGDDRRVPSRTAAISDIGDAVMAESITIE